MGPSVGSVNGPRDGFAIVAPPLSLPHPPLLATGARLLGKSERSVLLSPVPLYHPVTTACNEREWDL